MSRGRARGLPALPRSPTYRRRLAPRRADRAAGSDRLPALPDVAPHSERARRLPWVKQAAAPCRRFPCLARARRLAGPAEPLEALRASARQARGLRPQVTRASPQPQACGPAPCAPQVSAPPACVQWTAWRPSSVPVPSSSRRFSSLLSCARYALFCAPFCARSAPSSSRSCVDSFSYSLCASSHSFS